MRPGHLIVAFCNWQSAGYPLNWTARLVIAAIILLAGSALTVELAKRCCGVGPRYW